MHNWSGNRAGRPHGKCRCNRPVRACGSGAPAASVAHRHPRRSSRAFRVRRAIAFPSTRAPCPPGPRRAGRNLPDATSRSTYPLRIAALADPGRLHWSLVHSPHGEATQIDGDRRTSWTQWPTETVAIQGGKRMKRCRVTSAGCRANAIARSRETAHANGACSPARSFRSPVATRYCAPAAVHLHFAVPLPRNAG